MMCGVALPSDQPAKLAIKRAKYPLFLCSWSSAPSVHLPSKCCVRLGTFQNGGVAYALDRIPEIGPASFIDLPILVLSW